MPKVIVCSSFDNLRSADIRFLEEAGRLGSVHVLLWSDRIIEKSTGAAPKFPEMERRYLLEHIRFVNAVTIVNDLSEAAAFDADLWITRAGVERPAASKVPYHLIAASQLSGYAIADRQIKTSPGRKKVLITGCYDWLHSGHVRFFEEVNEHGDVYAIVGHDANIELLKGPGHPQFRQNERRYMVAAIRDVKCCLISTGNGWLDAEPEIRMIQPDIYAVNQDGDKPEKKEFCAANGIEYLVLKRSPKSGLPRRESTELRGF